MKQVKRTAEYTIYERRDGRYAIKNAAKQWVNGDDKVEILKKEKLVKAPEPKAKPAQQEAEEAATDAEAEKAEEEGKATGE